MFLLMFVWPRCLDSVLDPIKPNLGLWVCSSDWCGLCLCLWSILELQGRVGQRRDDEVGWVGNQKGSWGDGVQWRIVVEMAGRFFACLPIGRDCTRAVEPHKSWGQGLTDFLVLRWDRWGKGRSLVFQVCRLGQLSWEVRHSPVLYTGVGCTCAFRIC